MPVGIYISVPFCRSKCSYCNFASGVFARDVVAGYVERVCADIRRAQHIALSMGGTLERKADSVYLGGGTPTTLTPEQFERIFAALRQEFEIDPAAEITVECAPGALAPEMLQALVRAGVNRVSLGVQSFIDPEAAAVGRLMRARPDIAEVDVNPLMVHAAGHGATALDALIVTGGREPSHA